MALSVLAVLLALLAAPEPGLAQDPSAPSGATPAEPPQDAAKKPPPEIQKEIERERAAGEKAERLRRAAEEHPNDLRPHVEWLEGLHELRKDSEALALAPVLLEKFPKSPELYAAFGRTLMREGQFDLAGVQVQRALSLDPENAKLQALAGRIALIRGDARGAESFLRRAVGLDPAAQDGRMALGLLLERAGRYGEALELLSGDKAGGPELSARRAVLQQFVKSPPFGLPKSSPPVTVPFVIARGYPPFVKVALGEGIERLFLVDTASDEITITSETARALGLPERGEKTVKDAEGRERLTPASAIVEEMRIAGLRVRRIPVRVSPGLRYPDAQIAGALGRDFLRRFRVLLDYPAATMTLSRADGPPLAGVPFDLTSVILLDGYNGDRAVGKFILDTSSYTPGTMDAKFVAEETGLSLFSEGVKLINEGPYLFSFTMPNLKVGGIEFSRFPATAVDLRAISHRIGVNVRGVVGHSMLRGHRLELDFANQRLALSRAAAAPPPAAETAPRP